MKIIKMKNKNINVDLLKKDYKFIKLFKNIFLVILLVSSSFSDLKSQNCQIIDTAIVTNVLCHGDATGSIELFMIDTLGSYQIIWNNLEITPNIYNLTSATYSVQIIDDNNPACIQDTTFNISQPQDPLTSTVNLYQNVDCFGDSTGVAYANAIGGTLLIIIFGAMDSQLKSPMVFGEIRLDRYPIYSSNNYRR